MPLYAGPLTQQVVNKLMLTDGMQERSEPFLDTDRLTVRLVSNEDIFLFKAIAGRDDDIEDMNMLVQAGLDYNVLRVEVSARTGCRCLVIGALGVMCTHCTAQTDRTSVRYWLPVTSESWLLHTRAGVNQLPLEIHTNQAGDV